jgi:hypothetical protein
VRSWFRILFVLMLACQASDLLGFIGPEPCALTAQDDGGDQQCPPTCARCACCAQAVVIAQPLSLVDGVIARFSAPIAAFPLLAAAPSDVLHVPKSHLL